MKELIIPLFALTALFVIPAVIGLVAVISWFKTRNRLYQTIEDAIDKNAPPEVIAQLVDMTKSKEEKEEKKSVVKHLSEGGVLFALGIAFLVFRYFGGPAGVIFPGTFLTLFGLAKFGVAAYAARHDKGAGE